MNVTMMAFSFCPSMCIACLDSVYFKVYCYVQNKLGNSDPSYNSRDIEPQALYYGAFSAIWLLQPCIGPSGLYIT